MFKGKIIVSNNGNVITPYNKGDCPNLEKQTSIYDPVYYKYKEVTGFIVDYNNTKTFVTHQNSIKYIQNLFPNYEVIYMDEICPKKLTQHFSLNKSLTPTDIQYNILNQILNTKGNINNSKEWFVHLQTGFGKTLLAIYLSSIFGYKTLVMCFSTEILKQWIKSIKKNTNCDMSKVLLIDSSKILKGILEDTFDYERYDIFLCTPRILTSFCNKNGYEKLNIIFEKLGIGFKIFDEAHRNMANIVKINAVTNVRHTLYLSADFGQSDYELEQKYYRIFYKVPVIKPSEEFEVSMKYTKAVIVEYDSKPEPMDITSIYDKYGFNSQYYMNYQFDKGVIFDVVKFILNGVFKSYDGYRILILLTHIDHVNTLTNLLDELYGDKYTVGRFHSEVPEEEKDNTRDNVNIIVSTYSSFGTGMDVSNIKYVISLNQSNKIEDNQAAGRARPMSDGSDVYYFMVIDKGFKYSTNKLKTRLGYLHDTKIKEVNKIKYN